MTKFKRLTGLWKRTGKNGDFLVAGTKKNKLEEVLKGIEEEEITVCLFRNNWKNSDSHPDYFIVVAPQQKRQQQPATTPKNNVETSNETSDVPF